MSSDFLYLLFCCLIWSLISCGHSRCGNVSSIVRDCVNGQCVDDKCECYQGWTGSLCSECGGRIILTEDSGYVTDGPNDYPKARECSWLIQPKIESNVTIRLRLLEFATECGWDYLYIYDGDSASSPLLATFNGLIWEQQNGETSVTQQHLPEVVATSGSVFIHFFSDVEYVMKGFNISYSIHSCPQECSSRGNCTPSMPSSKCECSEGWHGDGCEFESCPANCSNTEGWGYCQNTTIQESGSVCSCSAGHQGLDCGYAIPSEKGFWTEKAAGVASFNTARSSHSGIIVGDEMWLFGGIQFEVFTKEGVFDVYNFSSNQWRRINAANQEVPSARYGHSAVEQNGTILIFGGREVTTSEGKDELWQFDTHTNSWSRIDYTVNFSRLANATTSPLALWGHSGTMVELASGKKIMLVMFGYNTEYEHSGFVFEYDLDAQLWSRAFTSGAKIGAAFEHTATWDPINRVCYIHGGMTYIPTKSSYSMTDALHSYQPDQKVFKVLRSSGVPRFLHSTSLSEGVLFSYGGCTHNDSNKSTGALCFSPSFMAYHVACDVWEHLPPLDSRYNPNRYGHVSLLVKGKGSNSARMVLHGGYDGRILDSLSTYQTSSCRAFAKNESQCTESHAGLSCMWDETECIAATTLGSYQSQNISCRAMADSSPSYCRTLKSCSSCLNSISGCNWCDNSCTEDECSTDQRPSDTCENAYCERFRSCGQCEVNKECQWKKNTCQNRATNDSAQCPDSCSTKTSCDTCVSPSCMWCSNKRLCVSTSSYVAQFPYGECMKWLNKIDQCRTSRGCGEHRTCSDCLADPFCGWCDDGSQTGLGICQDGSSSGPQTSNSSQNVISYTRIAQYNSSVPLCSKDSWFFSSCPLCQCNGHSKCHNQTAECISCEGYTTGEQCQNCVDGYFGMATNGGTCQPCECFNRATSCDDTSGDCFCSTKGAIGEKCDRCDNDAKYYGSNGTCFYRLLINYSFTFTLTAISDRYITAINFENTPSLQSDAELSFESQSPCTVRLTVYSRQRIGPPIVNASEEDYEYEEHEVDVTTFTDVQQFSYDLSGAKYGFGDPSDNATVRIYVQNFTVPIWIQVSLVQRNSFLLMLLLILFSVFLVLLLLTALVWKLKMLYDSCQQRRQHAEQLEQMAARPFGSVHLSFDNIQSDKPTRQFKVADSIDGLSEEICGSGHAAAVSVALWMPTGNGIFPQSGDQTIMAEGCSHLAIGTALLTRKPTSREADYCEQNATSKSHRKRMKIVFKRGRSSTAASANQPNSTTQSGIERNTVGNSGMNQGSNSENRSGRSTDPNQPNRPRSKRGRSSFSSLRSRSVSPGNESVGNSRRHVRRSRDTNNAPAFASRGQCTDSRSEGIAV